jgi:serine/threonine protein phosphatase PrpC
MTTAGDPGSEPGRADHAPSVLRICGATDVGLERRQNQDTFVIADLQSGQVSSPCAEVGLPLSDRGFLLVVCDGMGGAAAGDVAAQIAVSSIRENVVHDGAAVCADPGGSLHHAVDLANRAILHEAEVRPEERGMGTTCTAAIVMPGRLTVAQVGDSRAYLLRGGTLYALTKDQSLAAQLVDSGALSAADVRTFPHRNVLLQALGSKTAVEPVISDYELLPGDRVLLCSDGLHGPVSDPDILADLMNAGDLTSTTHALVDRALAAGGPDNVTVVLADYRD